MSDIRAESGDNDAVGGVHEASDDMLVLGIRMRDDAALAALYDRYATLVYTLALRMLQDRALAQGILEDVFIQYWHGSEQFNRTTRTLAGWLLATARLRAADLGGQAAERPGRRDHEPLDLQKPNSVARAESDGSVALRTAVVQAMAELSPPQREAIELAYFDGLTQSAIAARLGHSVGTVRVRIRDGARRLRRVLGPTLDGQMAGAGVSW